MRIILIAAFCAAATLSASAQFLKLGPKGGANLVKMDGVSFNDGFQLGYYAGAFVEMKLGEKWYLQPEVLFSETSLSTTNDFRDIYGNILDFSRISSMKLQSLSIPLTLNYRIANVLAISAGPQFSVLMDQGEGLLNNGKKAFTDGELGLTAGVNLMVGKFRVNGRYIWGLKEMNNIDNQDSWKSQTAQLGVGFVF